MKKLIIHETDAHGCGWFYYNGEARRYFYDDGCFGDIKTTIQTLIEIGFINKDEVIIFEGEEIYKYIDINCKDKIE